MEEPTGLEVMGLAKTYGGTRAVDNVYLKAPHAAFTVLLGPGGAGKTTLLRLLAGLEGQEAGRIIIDGREISHLAPRDRNLAMIFDNLALYPDKNGFQNMASALLHRKVPLEEVRARVFAVAEKLGLTRVLDRLPRTMSGGERQRLALGRALVRRPRFFLLDEPLSSLDAPLRLMIRTELKRLQREEGHSFLMATPDFTEALAVADSIVTFRGGRVVQTGSPSEIYENPIDAESARFVGSPRINLLRGECRDGRLRLLDLDLSCPARWLPTLAASGPRELTVGLRPENASLQAPGEDPGDPSLSARLPVVDVESLGRTLAVTVRRKDETVTFLADGSARGHVAIGRQIAWRLVDPESLLAFDPATGRSLLAPARA